MGLFLEVAIIPECSEEEARTAVRNVEAEVKRWDGRDGLKADECRFNAQSGGVSILINEDCVGYEHLAEVLSGETGKTVLLTYIYDEDFWGYYLYKNGSVLDRFCPIPEYFEDEEDSAEALRERLKGNAALVAEHFNVDESNISRYICEWTEELFNNGSGMGDGAGKAYPEDEFGWGDCWQMADFMAGLGYPYEWE